MAGLIADAGEFLVDTFTGAAAKEIVEEVGEKGKDLVVWGENKIEHALKRTQQEIIKMEKAGSRFLQDHWKRQRIVRLRDREAELVNQLQERQLQLQNNLPTIEPTFYQAIEYEDVNQQNWDEVMDDDVIMQLEDLEEKGGLMDQLGDLLDQLGSDLEDVKDLPPNKVWIPIPNHFPRHLSIRSMPYKRKYRPLRNKKSFKRSVKAIIKNSQLWLTDGYVNYRSLFAVSCYSSDTFNSQPNGVTADFVPMHGYKGLYETTFMSQTDIKTRQTYALAVNPIMPVGGAVNSGLPLATTKTLHWKNQYMKCWFHNPMTEQVQVRCWIVIYDMDMVSGEHGAVTQWAYAYNEHINLTYAATGATPGENENLFLRVPGGGPFKYGEVNNRYKLHKKFKTIFQPGQTKTWKVRLPSGSYNQAEYEGTTIDTGLEYLRGKSWGMILETMGVPTFQHAAMSYDTKIIGWSPSGIEALCDWNCKFAVSSQSPLKWEKTHARMAFQDSTDATLTLTASKGLIPQNEGTIRAV